MNGINNNTHVRHNQAETSRVLKKFSVSKLLPHQNFKEAFKTDPFELINENDSFFREKIFELMWAYRFMAWRKLKRETIAKKVGCCVKTVTRITNRWVELGILIKWQANPYAPCEFEFHPDMVKSKWSHKYWFSKLSLQEQEIYLTFGKVLNTKPTKSLQSVNVPQIKCLYSRDSYFNNIPYTQGGIDVVGTPFSTPPDGKKIKKHIQERESHIKGRIEAYVHHRKLLAEIKMKFSSFVKDYIIKHQSHPDAQAALSSPAIWPLLVSPLMEEISLIGGFDLRATLKLTVFSAPALEHLLGIMKNMDLNHVKDRIGWSFSILYRYSTKEKIFVDWGFYFALCTIFKIENAVEHPPKQEQKKIYTHESHKPWQPKVEEKDPIEKIFEYEEEIHFARTKITNIESGKEKDVMNFLKANLENRIEFLKSEVIKIKELHALKTINSA